jgi:lipoprotein-releasing system ATP-binding protein
MAEAILELCGITKSYGAETHAVTHVLHGIDLAILPGELTALVGPSGSGKSTLLNLMGLLDRPTSGRVLIQGRDTTTLDERALTRLRGSSIGFIFQFHHLLPEFTALENVMLPAYAERGRPSAELRERASVLLERVGLEERAHYKSLDLSGGQQQRVAIARALIKNPPLILADEPTGNLDTASASQVFDLLRSFQREQAAALLVVTHDSRLADRCDRVVTLTDGRIASDQRRAAG